MKSFITALLLLVNGILCANPLLERLRRAEMGDYLVVQMARQRVLLRIAGTGERLLIEELVAPADGAMPAWQSWIDSGAPGHTAWTLYEMSPEGQLVRAYSVSRDLWLQLEEGEQLFARLLQLPFQKVSDAERKRAGSAKIRHGQDQRPLWVPPIKLGGQRLEPDQVSAWSAVWPQDGSELAGHSLELYLLENMPDTPSCFPLWIEVSGQIAAVKLRTLDGGKGLFTRTALR
jgi:hypothetical protein